MSLLIPSDAIWRGASYYVLSPLYPAGASAGHEGIPFVGHSPPATAMEVWALLYPPAVLGAATVTFSRQDS